MESGFVEEDLSHYSDSELFEFICQSPCLAPGSAISLLTSKLVAKQHEPHEVEDTCAAEEAAHALGIRVPRVRRTFVLQGSAYRIMDRIEGSTLEEIWPKLSWFMTIKLALQLRGFVNLLRTRTFNTAGSLKTGRCRSFWLEDEYEITERSPPENITSFIRFLLDIS